MISNDAIVTASNTQGDSTRFFFLFFKCVFQFPYALVYR